MKAEIKPRINFEGRTRLEEVIPLSTPYLVFLDPSDKCNAKCQWCPTGSGEIKKYRKQGVMDFDLYCKIIDDLAAMPESIKTLRLYAFGEPLMNPRFPDMVRYAKNTDRFGQIDTTTNALLLNATLTHNIWASGLDKIFVSVPQNYSEEYIADVKFFYETAQFFKSANSDGQREIFVKIIGDGLIGAVKDKFFQDFGNICDFINIEYLAPCWPNYKVGKIGDKGIYGQEIIKEVQVCPYIFYSLTINSDGVVSLCFLDWKKEMVMGDLKRESFKDIWNSITIRAVRLLNLRGKQKYMLNSCYNCGQLKYGAPDNIDEYAEEILRRL